jgi:transcriptional regulator with XRE-family HTH domain
LKLNRLKWKIMRENSIKQRALKVPADIKLLVSKSMATAKQISRILEEQGKSQKDLANLLGKKESEISKWLQGTHNFTYKTICRIEIVLGEQIIFTADQAIQNISFFKAIASNKTAQKLCIENRKNVMKPSKLNRQKLSATADNSIEKNIENKLSLLESCSNN